MKETLIQVLIGILVIAATATGIFYQTDDAPIESISNRGQPVVYQGGGLYKYNPVSFVREGIIWDIVNLFIAMPLFIVAILLSSRNSLRGRLLLGGMLAYFFYVYLSCVMMYAFNAFFLVYVAVFSLSTVAFAMNAARIDISKLSAKMSSRFPRRLFIGYAFTFAASMVVLWLGRIVPLMRTGLFPEEFVGLNTLGSQALDLGLVVPLSLSTGILLVKRSPWGYYLCSVAMVVGLMMFISIPAWITVPLVQDGKTNAWEAIPFFLLSALGITSAVVFHRHVKGESSISP